jgi:hypothetical protein
MAQMFAVNDLDVPKVCACIRCTAATRSRTHVGMHVIVSVFISSALLMHPPVVPLQRVHALFCAQVLLFYAPQMEGMAKRIAKVSQCVQLCNIRSASSCSLTNTALPQTGSWGTPSDYIMGHDAMAAEERLPMPPVWQGRSERGLSI